MRSFLGATILGLSCLFSTQGWAAGLLESPVNGSSQSGQGTIFGWFCSANKIEIVADGSITVQAPYGTLRTDTQGVCGDTNNGWGFQVNWGNLGPGQHTVVVLADGVEFGRATVNVTTFGTDYLRGESGDYSIRFHGQDVHIQWSEALQNFVIAGRSSGTTPPPQTNADLQAFIGRWAFTYTIINTYTDNFVFQSVQTNDNISGVVGYDIADSGLVIIFRTADLGSSALPYTYIMLDPDPIICDVFVFNSTSSTTISGLEFVTTIRNGKCDSIIGDGNPLTGVKTGTAMLEVPTESSATVEARKLEEAQQQAATLPSVDHSVLQEMLRRAQP